MPVAANDPRVQRAAFAHLVGNDIDYLMKKYEIILGRRAKNFTPDVIMGDTMSVSRQHAKIVYNFDTRQFELIVLGRNGVMIDGSLYEPEYGPIPLKSKALLQIGDASFYFLLPKKLSKLFKSPETAVRGPTPLKINNPSSAVARTGEAAASAAAGGAGAGAAATTAATTPPPAALPTQQQMIQLIQEAAARQQQQQVLAAAVAAQQHQQQQQQAPLSPQQLIQLQQLQLQQQQRQQLAGTAAGGANLSPQQVQQIQIQLLLQQQRLMQQQQQQQKSPPK